MLDSLNDQTIGGYRLHVENLGRTRFFDQQNFELYLLDSYSNKSESPIFRGLYNAGRPSIYVPAWIDGEFVEDATLTPVRPLRFASAQRCAHRPPPILDARSPPGTPSIAAHRVITTTPSDSRHHARAGSGRRPAAAVAR